MQDSDVPISSAQMQAAINQIAKASDAARLTPLAKIVESAMDVETNAELDRREVIVKIETFDPRKQKSQARVRNASTDR